MATPEEDVRMAVDGRQAVVVGVDGSEQSRTAALWAAREATDRGLRLVVVSAVHGPFPELVFTAGAAPLPEVVNEDSVRAFAESHLKEIADECREVVPDVEAHLLPGRPAEVLREVGADAELVVVGWSGRTGLAKALLGSTAADLAHQGDRPTVVVRDSGALGQAVVVGVDGSPSSGRAADFAFDFADRHGLRVVAVHAWADAVMPVAVPELGWNHDWDAVRVAAGEVVERELAVRRQRYPRVGAELAVAFDSPAHALLEQARGAALLVVGSRGRSAVRRALLGSVSHAVVYHAPCTVAVVHGE
ncbi:universal stress protein [Saccharothrix longispora]|uniref:Nucleotide-binding universal stress UspA family protein n=1 Tax=Saccharothrix longispora TaxID=33920 RepID=A0ABU1PRI6_9PSEU|nr:universal stress protein [Saccharothrix longispora]MDR6593239.1 nucleotide-binding universal stress UspA family protein [Saccharothrix longispora]